MMVFHRTLSRLFPRSFTAKVFFVAFLGTHIPLIILVSYAVRSSGGVSGHINILGLVLAATLFGTLATLVALKAILRPIYLVESAMRDFENDGTVSLLPADLQDELGQLMQRTGRILVHLQERIAIAQMTADTDPLTGVLNRRGFERRTTLLVNGAALQFDIDHFKMINDDLGHDNGDEILRQVAQVVGRNLKSDSILARFGGDEFVVYFPEASRNEAQSIAECIRIAVENDVQVNSCSVTVSVGLSLGSTCLAELLKQADMATYISKREGRNKVTVFG